MSKEGAPGSRYGAVGDEAFSPSARAHEDWAMKATSTNATNSDFINANSLANMQRLKRDQARLSKTRCSRVNYANYDKQGTGMTIQQWLFSFRGRIGRRDFWIWVIVWFVAMAALFTLAGNEMMSTQTAAFILVCLLWPTASIIVKRLHDRGRSGAWALLMILSWMLLAGNWSVFGGMWQWAVGRLIPVVIMVMMHLRTGRIFGYSGRE